MPSVGPEPDMMRSTTAAFLRIVRAGHPGVPIVLASPVVRPYAEATPNKLGATLADLRSAMEEVGRILAADDPLLTVLPGGDALDPALLADGIHPGDEGHRVLLHCAAGQSRTPAAGARYAMVRFGRDGRTALAEMQTLLTDHGFYVNAELRRLVTAFDE